MKKFEVGSEEIIFDDDFEFYHRYYSEMREMVHKQCADFILELKELDSLDQILDIVSEKAEDIISNAISYCVDVLVENDIFDWDEDRISEECGEDIDFEQTEEYQEFISQYEQICAEHQTALDKEEIYKANRSYWKGGGFGISGAISGAIKAGAMNAVMDTFRGIGDRSRAKEINKQFENEKFKLKETGFEEQFADGIIQCTNSAFDVVATILEKEKNKNADKILLRDEAESTAIYNNLDRIKDTDKKIKLLCRSVFLSPYTSNGIEYALTNREELKLDFAEIESLGKYIDGYLYFSYKDSVFLSFCDEFIKEKTSEDALENIDKLKNEAELFGYIDKNGKGIFEGNNSIITMTVTSTLAIADIYPLLKFLWGEEHRTLTYDEIIKIEDDVKNVLNKYELLDEENGGLREEYKSSIEEIETVNIIEDLLEVFRDIAKSEYEKECAVDGYKFETLAEARLYKSEKESFSGVCNMEEKDLMYDKEKLKDYLERIDELNLCTKPMIEKKERLQSRLAYLDKIEEKSYHELGKEIVESFSKEKIDRLYLYGQSDFLKKAFTIKKMIEDKKRDLEIETIPIVIYDNTEKIAIFEEAIFFLRYTNNKLNMIMQPLHEISDLKSIDFENVIVFKTLNNKRLEIKLPKELPSRIMQEALQVVVYANKGGLSESGQYTYCCNCGMRLPEKTKFCPCCGKQQETLYCPNCGKEYLPGDKYCAYCGGMLNKE